jgi:hypothetical protein
MNPTFAFIAATACYRGWVGLIAPQPARVAASGRASPLRTGNGAPDTTRASTGAPSGGEGL